MRGKGDVATIHASAAIFQAGLERGGNIYKKQILHRSPQQANWRERKERSLWIVRRLPKQIHRTKSLLV